MKFDPLTFSSHRAIHHIEVPLVFTADQRDEIDKCGANQNYVNVINSMSYVISEEIKILRDKIKDLDDNKVTPNEGDIITNKNNIKSNKDEIPPLQAKSGDNYNEVLTKVNNHSHGLYASTGHSRNPSCPILSCTPCEEEEDNGGDTILVRTATGKNYLNYGGGEGGSFDTSDRDGDGTAAEFDLDDNDPDVR